jgi:hypothetical protein
MSSSGTPVTIYVPPQHKIRYGHAPWYIHSLRYLFIGSY